MVRADWVDLLRGAAILLVMHHHTVDSIRAKWPGSLQDIAVYTSLMTPLRMPVLFFLSGLLVQWSIKKGLMAYYRGKISGIYWPYLLWTFIMWGLYEVRQAVLGEPGFELIRALFTEPFHHLWFLYYLLGFYLITPLILKRWAYVGLAVAGALIFADSEFERLLTSFVFFCWGPLQGRSC